MWIYFLFVYLPQLKRMAVVIPLRLKMYWQSLRLINIVRSTVWVGFTDWAKYKYKKDIVFMPEYGPSEFASHPFQDIAKINWAILGVERLLTNKVAKYWEEI